MPSAPGTTVHEIALLQEGVSWFGDSWGPSDGTFFLTLDALPKPEWRAESLGGMPAAPWTATPGEAITGELRLRNTGTKTWPAGVVRLATTGPRDRESALFGLVAEGVTWFADAGGPADDLLVVQLTVAPEDTAAPDDTGDSEPDTDSAADSDSAPGRDTGGPTVIPGGPCGCGTAPGRSWAPLLALLALRRRPRRYGQVQPA